MGLIWTVLGVATALLAAALLSWHVMRRRRARERDPSWKQRRAERLVRRGLKALEGDQLDSARAQLEAGLALYRETGSVGPEIECSIVLGRVLSRLGDTVGALACLRRVSGLGGAEHGGLRFRAAMAMGDVLLEQNSAWLALACYREALIQPSCPENVAVLPAAEPLRQALSRVLRDKLSTGRAQVENGQYLEARRRYHEGLTLARDPLFLPFSQEAFPYHLSHYENLIRVELAHLHLRMGLERGTGTGASDPARMAV